MQKVVKRGLCLALSVVMVLMMFTALPSAALAEDDTDAIDIESPEGTGTDDGDALDATEADDADSDASNAAEDDAIENELAPQDSSITETEGDDPNTEEEPGDLAPMATGPVTIYINTLTSSTDNSGNVATQSQWKYDSSLNWLTLLTPNGDYTLMGTNNHLYVSAYSATNALITLNSVTISHPDYSSSAALSMRGNALMLVGANTINGSLSLDGNCSISGSGSLKVTGQAAVESCALSSTATLSIVDNIAVTFEGTGGLAIGANSPTQNIWIGDRAKLTMRNGSNSAEVHTFIRSNSGNPQYWKLTNATLTSGSLTSDTITVSVAAGATATVERAAATGMAIIDISTLGNSSRDNSGNVLVESPWRYEVSGSNRVLYLLAPNGNYTLTGSNSNLRVDAGEYAPNTSITLSSVTITLPSGRAAFEANGSTITLTGATTMNGSMSMYGNCTINGSGSLTATGSTGYPACTFIDPGARLNIAGSASVTFRGTNRSAIGVANPPIQMSDAAKLTMVNGGTSAETHSFTKPGDGGIHCWKLTNATLTSGFLVSKDITVNIAAGATATVERVAMSTGMVTINLSTLGSSSRDNNGSVSTQSQWTYDASSRLLNLCTWNGNYTLTGSNTNLWVTAYDALSADITLNGVTITPPSGRDAFNKRGGLMTLVGVNTLNGTLDVYGSASLAGSGSLTATGAAGKPGCSILYNTNLNITGSASVTFKGTGYRAIDSDSETPSIKISDTAKLTMVNGSGSVETHAFAKSGSDATYRWKLTGATLVSGSLTSDTITASVAAGATGTVEREKTLSLTYQTHVQNVGWQAPVGLGQMTGTSGQSLRLEGLKINLTNNTGFSGGITYATHVQNIGWQSAVTVSNNGNSATEMKGGLSGTEGKSLRLEAVRINLTGNLASYYDIYYRVHAQNVGWMGWAKNGADAGTAGQSFRLEALQIVVVSKGGGGPGNTYNDISRTGDAPAMIDPGIASSGLGYTASVHIQDIGDRGYTAATGATILGTSGESKRLEAMTLTLRSAPVAGSLRYEVHVQNIGWQGWKPSGQKAGTSGMSYRLEALRIELTGEMANQYDIYYRTHIQNIGWTGWAKNGQSCGSAGYSYRMEAMQIVIVPKSAGTAPGLNSGYFYQR